MEGRARAATRDLEARISQAWHTEAFAREKKLKAFKTYIGQMQKKPSKARGGNALLGSMLEMKAKGVPIQIKRVKLKPRQKAEGGAQGQP